MAWVCGFFHCFWLRVALLTKFYCIEDWWLPSLDSLGSRECILLVFMRLAAVNFMAFLYDYIFIWMLAPLLNMKLPPFRSVSFYFVFGRLSFSFSGENLAVMVRTSVVGEKTSGSFVESADCCSFAFPPSGLFWAVWGLFCLLLVRYEEAGLLSIELKGKFGLLNGIVVKASPFWSRRSYSSLNVPFIFVRSTSIDRFIASEAFLILRVLLADDLTFLKLLLLLL